MDIVKAQAPTSAARLMKQSQVRKGQEALFPSAASSSVPQKWQRYKPWQLILGGRGDGGGSSTGSAVPCSWSHRSRKPSFGSGSIALPQILWTNFILLTPFSDELTWVSFCWVQLRILFETPSTMAHTPVLWSTFALQYLPASDLLRNCLTLTLEWNLHEVKVIYFVHC